MDIKGPVQAISQSSKILALVVKHKAFYMDCLEGQCTLQFATKPSTLLDWEMANFQKKLNSI